eukprot:TCALIF_11606-PA protein Name:"Protein of unknown function" AED:0.28 eAED:0.62 QI:71/0/0.5/1/0/0.5/2/0/114
MKLALLYMTIMMALALETEAKVGFRCDVFSFLQNDRACRFSCWITGRDRDCFCGTIAMDRETPEVTTPVNKGNIGALFPTTLLSRRSSSTTEDPSPSYDHVIFEDSNQDYDAYF